MGKLPSLQELNTVVTGASSGIGKLLALRLARAGGRIALVARRARELEDLAAAIRAAGGEAIVLPCDVADQAQVREAAARALDAFGSVDLLVNNAAAAYVVRAVAPGFMRRNLKRTTIDAMRKTP